MIDGHTVLINLTSHVAYEIQGRHDPRCSPHELTLYLAQSHLPFALGLGGGSVASLATISLVNRSAPPDRSSLESRGWFKRPFKTRDSQCTIQLRTAYPTGRRQSRDTH
jgi:hypothetical protein